MAGTQAPFVILNRETGISMIYRNPKGIADQILRRIAVGGPLFSYNKWSKDEGFNIPNTRVGRKGKPSTVDFSATLQQSSVEDYALDAPLPNADLLNAQVAGLDPLGRATEGLTDLVALDRELRVASLVFDASQYPSANKETLTGNDQFSFFGDDANPASDPLAVITDIMDGMLVMPNKAVVGRAVASKLQRHPRIIKAYNGTLGDQGKVPLAYVAELLELDQILVGQGWYNAAKRGQADSMQRVWGKNMLLFSDNANVNTTDASQVTFGFTAEWGTRVAGTIVDPDVGMRGGQRLRVGESLKEVISAPDAAYLITGAVA